MSIRIREIDGEMVALCAAKTEAQEGDIYLNDCAHHALMVKFTADLESEGWLKKNAPIDEKVKELMLKEEIREKPKLEFEMGKRGFVNIKSEQPQENKDEV